MKMFNIGDLVQYDYSNRYGVVIDIKNVPKLNPPEKIVDVLVRWSDGEEIWCLDFCLILLTTTY